jgi:hypothetical protein
LKGSDCGLLALAGGDTGISLAMIWGLDSRDLAGRYEPRVLKLNPSPLGFGLAGTGLGVTGDWGLD